MAHKKTLLDKFKSEVSSDTSDCRSPRYDGTRWFIPETSLSENSQSTSGEDPENTPTTSNVQKPLEVNSRKSTSGIDDISPNIPTDNARENTSKWNNFHTDNSKLTSSGSVQLFPFLELLHTQLQPQALNLRNLFQLHQVQMKQKLVKMKRRILMAL